MPEYIDLGTAEAELVNLRKLIRTLEDKDVLGIGSEETARKLSILRQTVTYLEAVVSVVTREPANGT